jgi:uncharacterized membrane protein
VINIVGIVIGVVGAVLATVGLIKANKSGVGKGLAISGLILGVLALIVGVVVNVVFVLAVNNSANDVTVDTPTNVTEPTAANGATASEAATNDTKTNDAALGTSRDNPAPLGSAITDGDWTVTINSVTTANESKYGQTPAAGSTLLVINITATYNGNDPQGESAWASVSFVTAEGTTINSLGGSTMFIPEDQFDSLTTLYEGGSVTGNEMLEVPADSWQNGVLAVSPSLGSDHTFVAVQ